MKLFKRKKIKENEDQEYFYLKDIFLDLIKNTPNELRQPYWDILYHTTFFMRDTSVGLHRVCYIENDKLIDLPLTNYEYDAYSYNNPITKDLTSIQPDYFLNNLLGYTYDVIDFYNNLDLDFIKTTKKITNSWSKEIYFYNEKLKKKIKLNCYLNYSSEEKLEYENPNEIVLKRVGNIFLKPNEKLILGAHQYAYEELTPKIIQDLEDFLNKNNIKNDYYLNPNCNPDKNPKFTFGKKINILEIYNRYKKVLNNETTN